MAEPLLPPELTVYYDGSCPLCRREIAHYRRLDGGARVCWLDVSAAGAPLDAGLSCDSALRRFHVRDARGRLYSGGAAFARLWQVLPGWRVPGRVFAWPPLSWLLEGAYRAFLPLRPRLQRLAARWWPQTEAP